MTSGYQAGPVIAHASLREYFHGEISAALDHQRVTAGQETIHYLTNLLTVFSRSEAVFDASGSRAAIRPLALSYGEALNEDSARERSRRLQKLGDTALFVAGVFSDSLKTRLVDVDYYIAMGGSAYSTLCDSLRGWHALDGRASLFEELTRKFTDFVDVLNEVSANSNLRSDGDLLRLYEIWVRTGSKRARARLRRLGIEPLESGKPDFRH